MNVLFLLYDSLRADCVKQSHPWKGIADRSVSFSNVVTQSNWTKTSVASILSSMVPVAHKTYLHADIMPKRGFWSQELRRDSDFRTVGVSCNPWVSGQYGFGESFEELAEIDWDSKAKINTLGHGDHQAFGHVKATLSKKVENTFVFAHLMGTHYPFLDDDYWKSADECGRQLHRFLRWFEKNPNYHDTIVMIGSDHGESLGENGFAFHSYCMNEVETRVPFFVLVRGEPRVNDAPYCTVDIGPTICSVFGLDLESMSEDFPAFDMLLEHEDHLPPMSRIRVCDCFSDGKDSPNRGRKIAIYDGTDGKFVFKKDAYGTKLSEAVNHRGKTVPIDRSRTTIGESLLEYYESMEAQFAPFQVGEMSGNLTGRLKSLGYMT